MRTLIAMPAPSYVYLTALLALGASTVAATVATTAGWSAEVDFDTRIAPLLTKHCLACHGPTEPKGGLDLTTLDGAKRGGDSGVVLVPGKADESSLWQRISADEMPPKKPLNAAEKKQIRQWIDEGASWGKTPLDPLAFSSEHRAGYDWWAFQPLRRPAVPQLEDSTFVRNPIDAFVAAQLAENQLTPSPLAPPETLLRRWYFDLIGLPPTPQERTTFLAAWQESPDQAARDVINHLLDSRHFGERWGRHWLDVARFGESQGFERDKLRTDSWHYRDWVIQALNDDMPYDEFVRLQLAGDVLHPDDPQAVIATGFLVAGPWDEVGQNQQSAAMKAVVRQDELEDYVSTIGQSFLGLTVHCARCHDHKFDPISQREYYQLASAVAGVRHGSRSVLVPQTEELSAESGKQEPISVYAVVPKKPGVTHVLLRGNPATPGDSVPPGGVAAVGGLEASFQLPADSEDAARRRKLAEWITSPQNPLFARVIVNRLWHYHFGAGLVKTPNDFGFHGGHPSHPELLDWLANELIQSGWSLKHVHRLIVSSNTFRQASRYRPECGAKDAGNRLLWRKQAARMEAEVLRDSILHVSGQWNSQYGGAPYRDFETFTHNTQFYTTIDPDDRDAYRRTVYRTWVRSGRNYFLDAFDCPDPSTTAPSRAVTTTPIQSLTLMNNSFVLRMADRFADRLRGEVGDDVEQQVQRAVSLAYGREVREGEGGRLADFVAEHGLSALCRVLFNSNEFIYVD